LNHGSYRLIALDLDGTLLNSRKEIAPRTREALTAARERGIITVIATGRTPHSALHFSRQIGGGPVICCNGAGVLDPSGSYLAKRGIPQAPLVHLLKLGAELGVMMECYTTDGIRLDRPLQQARGYYRYIRPRVRLIDALRGLARMWSVNNVRPVRNIVKWAEQPGLPTVLKANAVGDGARLAILARQIEQAIPSLEVTSSGPDNLEMTAPGVNKGTGLEQLAAHLKIPREAIIAMGDSDNDKAMIRYAGLGVAMGNAADEVKQVADRITATCDEHGVAKLIEEMCLS
jgi:hydroxymethylpyrimidine pyrophosphatase-like HAD family hydrolase